MTRPIGSIVSSVFTAVLVAFAGAILPGTPASATDDCVAAPKSPPPQGKHWYYRTDREKQRKCWYLAPQGQHVHRVAPRAAPRVPPVAGPPAFPNRAPASEERADSRSTGPAPVEQTAPQSLPANGPVASAPPVSAPGDVWKKLDTDPLQRYDAPNPLDIVERERTMSNASTGQIPPEATGAQDTEARSGVRVEPLAAAAIRRTDPGLFIAGAIALAGFVMSATFGMSAFRHRLKFANRRADQSDTAPFKFASTFDIKDVPPLPPIGCTEPPVDGEDPLRKLLRDLEGIQCKDRAHAAGQVSHRDRSARPLAEQGGRGRAGQQDGASSLDSDTLKQRIAPAA
jgi:hypothetical protein